MVKGIECMYAKVVWQIGLASHRINAQRWITLYCLLPQYHLYVISCVFDLFCSIA